MGLTRVLVVDDNDMSGEMAKFVLTQAGHLVDTASNAAAALSSIPVFQPDLVLMDVQMPVIDGIELTRQLKADPATRHIVVVAFTAYAAKGDRVALTAAGFDGYIGKPINVATLAAEVSFWFDGPPSAQQSHFVWP